MLEILLIIVKISIEIFLVNRVTLEVYPESCLCQYKQVSRRRFWMPLSVTKCWLREIKPAVALATLELLLLLVHNLTTIPSYLRHSVGMSLAGKGISLLCKHYISAYPKYINVFPMCRISIKR